MDRSEPDAVKEECCRENEELLVGRELLQEQLLQQRFAELELQVQESREKASVAEQAKIEKERDVLDLQTHITNIALRAETLSEHLEESQRQGARWETENSVLAASNLELQDTNVHLEEKVAQLQEDLYKSLRFQNELSLAIQSGEDVLEER